MQILRNVFRRKLRVFLTIFGITIGILALVVMGGMAEKINLLVSGGTKYYKDKVIVGDAGSSLFVTSPFSISKLEELRQVPGVAEVSGYIDNVLDPEQMVNMGMIPTYMGSDMRGDVLDAETFPVTYSSGRALTPEDAGCVVVGSGLVSKLNAKVGGTVTVRGEEFQVVGIMGKTLTAPDTCVMMTLPDAQHLFVQDMPEFIRDQVDPYDLVTYFTVYTEKGVDPEELASLINATVEGVEASGPSVFEEQLGGVTVIFNTLLYGIALISLIVGGLSVINTMTMSVSERTREIGVRKAIGASDGQIVRQFLAEAGVIGLIGGATGLIIGWLVAVIANACLASQNLDLFLVTPRLAIGSVIFAVLLGLISGLYPSLHAARMKPVNALRYE